jgi:hypothetical protein
MAAPGQTPAPIGDHIRLRIRQICDLSLLVNAKALLDYDNQLYTVFLPDSITGLNTRILTVNLRNGGWWGGALADNSIAVTDTLAYRINPWQTLNLTATADGRIFQTYLGCRQDAASDFPCSWTSSIFSIKTMCGSAMYELNNMTHEQASIQTLRVIGEISTPGVTPDVFGKVIWGNGVDHMATESFTPDQFLSGDSNTLLMMYGRVTCEFFQVLFGSTQASKWPNTIQFEAGFIGQGVTR